MNTARACWEEIILANGNLTWVILVTQDNLCIHKHNIYYPTRGNTSHEEQRTFHLCPSHKHQSSLFWRDHKQIKPHSKSISKMKCRQPEFSQKVRVWQQPGESTEPVQNNTSTGRCLTPADCWDYSDYHSDTAACFHSSRHQQRLV